jgi:ribonuclease D
MRLKNGNFISGFGLDIRDNPAKLDVMTAPKIYFHKNDLPANLDLGDQIAVDCEMMGLSLIRDRLCLVQLRGRDTDVHLVKIDKDQKSAPNLQKMMEDKSKLKFFHFARIDMAMMKRWLDIDVQGVFCTKIASKLTRTYTERHGLQANIKELIGIDLSKQQSNTNWGDENLDADQLEYAASDVLYMHALKDRMVELLNREGRMEIAQACFDFLPARVALDLLGWNEHDIFQHS